MRVLLTGPPAVGKTTACIKLAQLLGGDVEGFYTEEVVEGRQRSGFDIVTINQANKQKRAVLARKNSHVKGPKVGPYTVHLQDFESVAMPCLNSVDDTKILIIDEIGKMESKSTKFSAAIRKVFNEFSGTIVATIPKPAANPLPLVEEVKCFPNTEIITVNKENRDALPELILDMISKNSSSEIWMFNLIFFNLFDIVGWFFKIFFNKFKISALVLNLKSNVCKVLYFGVKSNFIVD